MAEATLNKVTEVVREDVVLTMTKGEAERIYSVLGRVAAGDGTHAVYNALGIALGGARHSIVYTSPYRASLSPSGASIRVSRR
jgi:hypothetical protein